MTIATKVLLIEDNRIEARQTQHWLSWDKNAPFDVECVDLLQAGLERLAQGGIDIVLLDLNLPDSRGLETFVKLHDQSPQVPVVVLTGEYDESNGPRAVESGAQDYLVKQQVDAYTLARVLRHALARHRASQEETSKSKRGKKSRVIGFIGAKGGAGTTTTALNVALALSLQGKSVILVELRPSFGTLSCHLNRVPHGNLRSLLDLPVEQIRATKLDPLLCQGHAGLRILFGPQQAQEAQEIGAQHAETIIKCLSGMAEYVVLDLPNQPSAATQAAAHLCHFIAIVTEREPAAVISGKVTVNQLQSWSIGGDLVGAIVINRTIFPVNVELSEIRSGIGCPIVGNVPWAATACLRALRDGSPLVVSQTDHDAALSMTEIAVKFVADKLVSMNL